MRWSSSWAPSTAEVAALPLRSDRGSREPANAVVGEGFNTPAFGKRSPRERAWCGERRRVVRPHAFWRCLLLRVSSVFGAMPLDVARGSSWAPTCEVRAHSASRPYALPTAQPKVLAILVVSYRFQFNYNVLAN